MNKRIQKLTQKLKQGKVHLLGPGGKCGGKRDDFGVAVNGVEHYDITNANEAAKKSKRKGAVQCSSSNGFSRFDPFLHRRTLEESSTTATPFRKNSHGRSWSTGSIVLFATGKRAADRAVGQEARNRQRWNEGGAHFEPWAHSLTRGCLDGSTVDTTTSPREQTLGRALACCCLRDNNERLFKGVHVKEPDAANSECRRCRYEPDEKWETDDVHSQQIITVAGVCFRLENTPAKPMGGEKFLSRLRGQFRIPDPLSLLCTRPYYPTAGYLGDPQVRFRLRTAANSKFDEMLVCGVPGPYGPEFTIRITLTPWHARATDEEIYGILG